MIFALIRFHTKMSIVPLLSARSCHAVAVCVFGLLLMFAITHADELDSEETACFHILFPPKEYILRKDDPSHITVSIGDCPHLLTGSQVFVLLNSALVHEGVVIGEEIVFDAIGMNRIVLGWNEVRVTSSSSNLEQTSSLFYVSAEYLQTSFSDLVLQSAPQLDQTSEWPWHVNNKPFFLHHAKLAAMKPSVKIVWPPAGYTFKRMQYGPTAFSPFLRVDMSPTFGFNLAMSIDGGGMSVFGPIYFLNLHLEDGEHNISVALTTPDSQHVISDVQSVSFSVNQSVEYEEDGGGEEGSKGLFPFDADLCSSLARDPDGCKTCERGMCVDGSCSCFPDYFGESCNFSILSDTRYLPVKDPSKVWDFSSCQKFIQSEKLSQAMEEKLYKLQFPQPPLPSSHSSHHVLHLSLDDTSGFGVTLHLISQIFSSAIRNNQTVVMRGKFSYFRHRACRSHGRREDLTCFFESTQDAGFDRLNISQITPTYTANYQLHNDWHLPQQLNTSGGGLFFFISQLSRFLMTPNRNLEALVRRVKRRIGYEHPIMGVHVRHGDSCPKWEDKHSHLPGAKCEKLERYVEEMYAMKRLYGVDRVFVCTDDPVVIEELSLVTDFQFVFVPFDRKLFSASDWAIELKLLMATLDRRLAAESTILDILLLAGHARGANSFC
mmetsp:Transcript_32499/g.73014  ORF Transcript_32499/g.73014 Transcript_32499/m.73014 type:complete len:662 (-) Transcript_32499:1362-3347(-)